MWCVVGRGRGRGTMWCVVGRGRGTMWCVVGRGSKGEVGEKEVERM